MLYCRDCYSTVVRTPTVEGEGYVAVSSLDTEGIDAGASAVEVELYGLDTGG